MVAPSTMKALREDPDRVTLCLFCYCGTENAEVARSVLREHVAAPTEAQLTEIAQSDGPEAAQKLREFFRQRDGN